METPSIAALEARVAEHPWQAVGAAFLLGAWVGAEPPHVPRNQIARAVFAMIGSITIRILREAMLRELGTAVVQPPTAAHEGNSSSVH